METGTAKAGEGIEAAGDVLHIALPVAALSLAAATGDREGAFQFAESAAIAFGVTGGLKYSVNEKRPNGGEHSFPSWHSSISFASAEFVRKRYGWEYGLPAYALASFTAFSRVESRQHYWRDVFAGAAIGIGSGYLFTRSYAGWQVNAEAGGGHCCIRLSRSW